MHRLALIHKFVSKSLFFPRIPSSNLKDGNLGRWWEEVNQGQMFSICFPSSIFSTVKPPERNWRSKCLFCIWIFSLQILLTEYNSIWNETNFPKWDIFWHCRAEQNKSDCHEFSFYLQQKNSVENYSPLLTGTEASVERLSLYTSMNISKGFIWIIFVDDHTI